MIDGFIAKVDSYTGGKWVVTPQIINDDGQQHDQIEVISRDGITPKTGDLVFVMTIKNNHDFSNIQKYFPASYTNGVIVGIAISQDGFYYIEGDYNFKGSFEVDGSQVINQTLEVNGNTRSLVTHGELTSTINKLVTDLAAAFAQINAVIGVPIPVPGVYPITIDISSSKTDNIKTGPG